MKILHIIPVLSGGGATRAMVVQAQIAQRRFGQRHYVAASDRIDQAGFQLAQGSGIEVCGSIASAGDLARAASQFDIIQFEWWNSPGINELMMGELPPGRYVAWCHVGGEAPPQVITRALIDRVNVAVACSPHTFLCSAIQSLAPDVRAQRVRMFFAAADLARLDGLQRVAHSEFNVPYVGTVQFNKMHPDYVAISAAAQVPGAKFIVCGQGIAARVLQQQAALLNRQGSFDIRGYVSDIRPIYAAADVFGYPLCPDTYAASELTLQEAMYSGVPAVVFPYGGLRELVISDLNGLVVHSTAEYSQALEYLYRSPDVRSRLAAGAQHYAREHFDPQRTAQEFHQLYQELLQMPPQSKAALSWGSSGAEKFVASLGDRCPPALKTSLIGADDVAVVAAEQEIAAASEVMTKDGIEAFSAFYGNDPHLHLWRGLALATRGESDVAFQAISRAYELGLRHWRLLWYIVNAAERGGVNELVQKVLPEVRRLAPHFQPAIDLEKRLLTRPRPVAMPPPRPFEIAVPKGPTDLPPISLVTPSYNQGEFLERCIQSILSQGYPKLEYMILDGGSTDGSVEIIKRYEKYLSFWRSSKDAGHYAAIQEGLARSRGEIMGWLNSDDMLHCGALHTLGELMKLRPDVRFVTGQRIGFDAHDNRMTFGFESQRWSRQLLLDPDNFGEPFLCVMQEGTYWRRDLWNQAGGTLDINFTVAADFELWMRFLRHAQLHTVQATLGGFRMHGAGQRSQIHKETYLRECLAIISREAKVVSDRPELDSVFPDLIQLPIRPLSEMTPRARPSRPARAPQWDSAKSPRISIVTPSFNMAEYLEECIDSVLSQPHCNVDYSIIDGGSTDGSVEIIKKYEKYLTYWVSEPDRGQYDAINKGFARSRGEIMGWLNADDKFHFGALGYVAALFKNSPSVEWITGVPSAWREDGELLWVFCGMPTYRREATILTDFSDPWIQQESVLWRRSLWERCGGALDLRWPLAADLDLWRRFFREAQLYSFAHIIGGARLHPNQRSAIHLRRYLAEAKAIVAEEKALFRKGEYTLLLPSPDPIRLG